MNHILDVRVQYDYIVNPILKDKVQKDDYMIKMLYLPSPNNDMKLEDVDYLLKKAFSYLKKLGDIPDSYTKDERRRHILYARQTMNILERYNKIYPNLLQRKYRSYYNITASMLNKRGFDIPKWNNTVNQQSRKDVKALFNDYKESINCVLNSSIDRIEQRFEFCDKAIENLAKGTLTAIKPRVYLPKMEQLKPNITLDQAKKARYINYSSTAKDLQSLISTGIKNDKDFRVLHKDIMHTLDKKYPSGKVPFFKTIQARDGKLKTIEYNLDLTKYAEDWQKFMRTRTDVLSTLALCQQAEIDLVRVQSAYANTCPICKPYHKKVFRRPDLKSSATYPTLTNIPPYHPNCHHYLEVVTDTKANAKEYESDRIRMDLNEFENLPGKVFDVKNDDELINNAVNMFKEESNIKKTVISTHNNKVNIEYHENANMIKDSIDTSIKQYFDNDNFDKLLNGINKVRCVPKYYKYKRNDQYRTVEGLYDANKNEIFMFNPTKESLVSETFVHELIEHNYRDNDYLFSFINKLSKSEISQEFDLSKKEDIINILRDYVISKSEHKDVRDNYKRLKIDKYSLELKRLKISDSEFFFLIGILQA